MDFLEEGVPNTYTGLCPSNPPYFGIKALTTQENVLKISDKAVQKS